MSPFATERLEVLGISPDARVPYTSFDALVKIIEETNKGERSVDDVTAEMFDQGTVGIDNARLVRLGKLIGMALQDAEREVARCASCIKSGNCGLQRVSMAMVAESPSKGVVTLDQPFEVRIEAIRDVMNDLRPAGDVANDVFYGTVDEAGRTGDEAKLLAIAEAAKIDRTVALAGLRLMRIGSNRLVAAPSLKPLYEAVLRTSA